MGISRIRRSMAVMHALDGSALLGEIAPLHRPLADLETSVRITVSGEIPDILRGPVERYAAREISARWSS